MRNDGIYFFFIFHYKPSIIRDVLEIYIFRDVFSTINHQFYQFSIDLEMVYYSASNMNDINYINVIMNPEGVTMNRCINELYISCAVRL